MRSVFVLAVVLLLPAGNGWADPCDEKAPRQAELGANGITSVSIEAKAGSLSVSGRPGATTIRAHGTACASTTGLLQQIRLTATRRGSTAVVAVEIPDTGGWGRNRAARLDLIIEVPAGMSVRIDDSSGNTEVTNVGNLDIEDGSGSIRVSNTRGNLKIDDGSGEIEIQNIAGDVMIEDGSGSIEAREIHGSLVVDDSSGGITVRSVRRNVTVDDSSGGIDVSDVGGDFTVRSDGSGGIDVSEVRGKVNIPRKRD